MRVYGADAALETRPTTLAMRRLRSLAEPKRQQACSPGLMMARASIGRAVVESLSGTRSSLNCSSSSHAASVDRARCSRPPPAQSGWPAAGQSARWSGRLGGLRVAGQRADELIARADVELREHLAQVVLDRARADEEPRADLRVRESVACQLGDLRLLRASARRACLGVRARDGLAGGEQLAAGALRERRGTHGGEHLVGGAQLLAGIDAALLAAQPLAVERGARGPDRTREPAATEPLDRLR